MAWLCIDSASAGESCRFFLYPSLHGCRAVPCPRGECGGLDVRLAVGRPCLPPPRSAAVRSGWGAESVEKVCRRSSRQGACSVLLGFMPQVPLYCRPLPFDLSLRSCLLHTFPCLSRVLALKSLAFLLCCLQRTRGSPGECGPLYPLVVGLLVLP